MGTATVNQAYHYKSGDRPLEGFTIQRGVGRGAFGEVYYALSDSGREVALKCILGYEQIELRGVSQCMNLKSPYLVSIFDLRQNDRGQNFVVMEYVAGPSLRDLLNDSPSGLGTQKAAFFLREIGKGLTYLHDRGIVHRDLKPGNIFYEDGYVKIGDYGLSKAIAPSQHSGQTITVGTVHYMAPEIGQGRYDKGIDVYALGVLTFEMLTGHVPFFGASHGEILMKHLMETPDVSGIEEPFAAVIKKAMAKDPADRYQSVQEMVEAVFGAEHIQQSVSVFRPESLSVVAERAARKVVTAGGPGSSAELPNALHVERPVRDDPADSSDVWLDFGRKVESVTQQVQRATGEFVTRTRMAAERMGMPASRSYAHSPETPDLAARMDRDPMSRRQRRILAGSTAAVMGLGTAFLHGQHPDVVFFCVFTGIVGGVGGLRFGTRMLANSDPGGLTRRLMLAIPGFLGMLLCSGLFLGTAANTSFARESEVAGTYFAVGVAFLLIGWDKVVARNRSERVMLGQALWAGALAFSLAALFDGLEILAMGMMAGTALVVQIASPFVRTSRTAATSTSAGTAARPDTKRSRKPAAAPPPLPGSPAYSDDAWARRVPPQPSFDPGWTRALTPEVPLGIKIVWLGVLVVVFGLGLFCAVASEIVLRHEETPFISGAVACGTAVIGSIVQVRRRTYFGWWGSLVRPLLMIVSFGFAVFVGITVSEPPTNGTQRDFMLICTFFAAFAAAIWLVLLFIPKDLFGRPSASRVAGGASGYAERSEPDQSTATLLACLGIFGVFGLHRFYVGKIWTGLLYLCTGGLLLVGQIYDFFLLVSGEFEDASGRKICDKPSNAEFSWGHGAVSLKMGPADVTTHRTGEPGGPPPGASRSSDAHARPAALDPRDGPDSRVHDEHGEIVGAEKAVVDSTSPGPRTGRLAEKVRREPRRTSLVLSALAHAFLVPAVLVGAAVAFQLPYFARVGMPFPGLGPELDMFFEYSGWPGLLARVGTIVSVGLLVIAALLLAIARREAGAAHVSRAVLGVSGLLMAGTLCSSAFFRLKWLDLMGDGPQLQKLEIVMNQVDSKSLLLGSACLIAASVLLVWPERRKTIAVDERVREGVAA